MDSVNGYGYDVVADWTCEYRGHCMVGLNFALEWSRRWRVDKKRWEVETENGECENAGEVLLMDNW